MSRGLEFAFQEMHRILIVHPSIFDTVGTMHTRVNDSLGARTEQILRHPRFEVAVMQYIPRVITWRARMGVFNRVSTTLGMHILNFVIYLHYANRAGVLEHGATYSNILEICERRQQCGTRALRTVLSMMRVMGYLEIGTSAIDGRVKEYVPGPKLVHEVIEGFSLSLSVLDSLEPGHAFAERVRTDEALLTDMINKSGHAVVMADTDITEVFPKLHSIIMKAGGFPTSISIVDAHQRGADFPPFRSIARKFKISQSQVRSVCTDLATCGLVERDEDSKIKNASKLAAEHKALIARELALHLDYALADRFELSCG